MKKVIFALVMFVGLVVPSFGSGMFGGNNAPASSGSSMANSVIMDTSAGNLEQSRKLLDMSIDLLKVSQSLQGVDGLSGEYVTAMLRLSDDIGIMADRIGVMADRIVETEVLIGVMADRIVVTAGMIDDNDQATQANLLQA